jgi:hypothetical protein
MTIFDWVLDTALILLVILQMRATRFDFRAVALPLALAGIVGAFYLRAFPTAGGGLMLVLALTVTGAALGTASGLTTRVWRDADRHVLVQASASAAALWLVGMVGRAGFQFWADGPGSRQIGELSVQWHIASAAPWIAGLVLMALAQVVARVIVLLVRARTGLGSPALAPARAAAR